MKSKSIILLGTGGIVGFVSCGVLIAKRALKNETMREILKQIICDKADQILYGGKSRYRRPCRVSYSNYYNCRDKSHHYEIQRYIFDNIKDAEKTLDDMWTIIETYGFVSVADVCDLCGINSNDYRLNKYGWINISGCKPIRVRGGWEICLPKPIQID